MKKNKVLSATIWYTISGFLMKGMGLLTTPIFSRILTQEEYGGVENFYACLSIITILGSLSLSASLIRARFDYENELNSFVKSNLVLGTAITILGGGIILFNFSFFSDILRLDYKLFLLIIVSVVVSPAYDMFVQIERFQYKYKVVVLISMLNSIMGVLLSLLLIHFMENNYWARILGGQIPVLVIGVVLYVYFLFKGKKIRISYMKYALPICVPYMLHLLSGTILNCSDRIMITKMCGESDNALYSMSYNVAQAVNVLWMAMNSAFMPWQCEQLHSKAYSKIKKYSYVYILVFICCVMGMMLIAPELLMILGGKRYVEAKNVIPPVMMGYVFLFLYSLYVNIEQYEKKNAGMAVATMTSAIVNIFLNVVLIPLFGFEAAAYTTMISYFLLFLLHYILVSRMKMEKCFDSKLIWTVSILLSIISIGIIKLYDLVFLRFLILFFCGDLFFGILVGNRKKIKDFLKSEVIWHEKSDQIFSEKNN